MEFHGHQDDALPSHRNDRLPGDLIAYERVSCWKSSEGMLGLSVSISPSSWDLQPTYLLKYLVNSSNLLFMGLTTHL